mmetsp:Transcript_11591/g.17729  ORF Transcript_11591/g.17729 Transcript_11591/m.17729 type:complete len:98 (-) Transcript_11591:808-1101(-)
MWISNSQSQASFFPSSVNIRAKLHSFSSSFNTKQQAAPGPNSGAIDNALIAFHSLWYAMKSNTPANNTPVSIVMNATDAPASVQISRQTSLNANPYV